MLSKEYKILNGTYEFIIKHGLEKFSLNELLKYLNISKGTFYHYFDSKDKMLLEIFEYLTSSYIKDNQKKLKKASTLKEKLEVIFEAYLDDSKEYRDFLIFYKEFILNKNYSESLKKYTTQIQVYFKDSIFLILDEEIKKGEIKPEAINFITTIMCLADGILIHSYSLDDFDLKDELINFIDSFIELVEIKK